MEGEMVIIEWRGKKGLGGRGGDRLKTGGVAPSVPLILVNFTWARSLSLLLLPLLDNTPHLSLFPNSSSSHIPHRSPPSLSS